MKHLYVRCDEETFLKAHQIAKNESRSLNKQLIYMINKEADLQGITVEVDTSEEDNTVDISAIVEEVKPDPWDANSGLQKLSEIKKQD